MLTPLAIRIHSWFGFQNPSANDPGIQYNIPVGSLLASQAVSACYRHVTAEITVQSRLKTPYLFYSFLLIFLVIMPEQVVSFIAWSCCPHQYYWPPPDITNHLKSLIYFAQTHIGIHKHTQYYKHTSAVHLKHIITVKQIM